MTKKLQEEIGMSDSEIQWYNTLIGKEIIRIKRQADALIANPLRDRGVEEEVCYLQSRVEELFYDLNFLQT